MSGIDTTKIKWVRQLLANFLLAEGYESGMGPSVLEYAPEGNTYATIDGTAVWEIIGVLENEPKIANTLNMFELEVGQIKQLLDTFYRGRKVEIDISIMAPSLHGLALAFGSKNVQVIEPSVTIRANVDATSVTPNKKRFAINAIGSLVAGQTIAIPCGDADSGVKLELKRIKSIDATTKIVTLVQPLSQLPVQGAQIKVVERVRVVVGDEPVEAGQYRLTKFYPDGSIRIYYFKSCKQKECGMPDGGDGATPEKYSAKLAALATWDIDDDGEFTTEFFVSDRIYQTEFS